MWSLLAVAALACCGSENDPNAPDPPAVVIEELKQDLQTGSLIFSQGDCLAVKIFSQSSYTHVGGVVEKNGEFLVYDSMNGTGVRRTPLTEYIRQQTPGSIHVVHPKVPFDQTRVIAYEQHLESQIGRKYAVKHHLTGSRSDGLHCSEYMTDALMAVELMSAKHPSRVSPGSLLEGVITTNAYRDGAHIDLESPEPARAASANQTWYRRAWDSTAHCCTKGAVRLRRWMLCR